MSNPAQTWQQAERARLIAELGHWEVRSGVPTRYLRPGWFRPELIPPAVANWNGRGSMLIAGPPGTGKSVAAWRAMRRYYGSLAMSDSPRRATGRFLSVADLFAMVFQKDFESIEYLAKVDVLVLDDIGIAHETAWPLAELDRLVDRRWQHERSTICTTNIPANARFAEAAGMQPSQAFDTRYGRVFSRITDREGPGLIVVDREDMR